DYPVWITLRGEAIDREDVVTAELGTILVANAGHLVAKEGALTTLVPLFRSSRDSMLLEVSEVRFRSEPEKLLANFAADEESYVIAARLTGEVKSAFEGPPEAAPEEGAEDEAEEAAEEGAGEAAEDEAGDESEPDAAAAAHLAEGKAPLNVIVVADADMLDDRFWLSRQTLLGQEFLVPTSANADFLINALDNLAGSSDLISLRSRARSDRPFEVIESIRRDAEQRYLAREKELQETLEETEKKLAELQSKASGGGASAILSAEEAQTIESFRQDLVATRKELRGVQHDLRKDIESLETWLKFLNIGAVPLAVFVVAIALALVRHQRRKASAALKQA
ncbi:MAG: ABC transporter, partial [Alphaproteobacteria bacterium]